MGNTGIIFFQPFADIPAKMMQVERTDTVNRTIDRSRALFRFKIHGKEFHRRDKIVNLLGREHQMERRSGVILNLLKYWR